MIHLVDRYLESRKNKWSPSTLKSETARLRVIAPLLDGNANNLWNSLQSKGKYTRITTWTRAVTFWRWCLKEGHVNGTANPYEEFRSEESRLFANGYQRKPVSRDFRETLALVGLVPNEAIKAKAVLLLLTGLRYFESNLIQPDGTVVGKGGKLRKVPNWVQAKPFADAQYRGTYITFLRAMHKVGLLPHDARKIFVNHVLRSLNLNAADLCQLMGWSSWNTAQSYIQAAKVSAIDEQLSALLKPED